MENPKLFHLQRETDCSGVSGIGIVAFGVIWENGQVSLKWNGERGALNTYPDIQAVEEVHGHNGCTKIVFS